MEAPMKTSIKRRRNGQVVSRISVNLPTTQSKPIKARGIAATIPGPTRKQMTRNMWQEYGDLLRGIKRLVPEYQGLEYLSLNDLRDAREGIRRADMIRAIALTK